MRFAFLLLNPYKMPRICIYGPAATGKTSKLMPLLMEIAQLAGDYGVYTLGTPPHNPEWYDMIFEVRGEVSAKDLQWLRVAIVKPKPSQGNIQQVK